MSKFGMSGCRQSQHEIHTEASFPEVSFIDGDEATVSSVPASVMVADDGVTLLVDDVQCSSRSSELNKATPQPFVSPFDESDCLGGTAADHEYVKDETQQQEGLCMMDDVVDSYEDSTMVTMDGVSVVCDEPRCDVDQLSSTHEQVLDEDACQHEDNRLVETSHESAEDAPGKVVEPLINGCSSSIYQMITNADGTLSLVSLGATQLDQLLNIQGGGLTDVDGGGLQLMQIQTVNLDSAAGTVHATPLPVARQLCDCPLWVAYLNDYEHIGNSYRGWVETEADLDYLLSCYKQATGTYWGTRQSPSPSQKATRLMWKSQYVPFDGIPFINIGSRAVVLECQFGPRRKNHIRKTTKALFESTSSVGEFRHCCPARVYIKKVRKFPDCAVDISLDKKQLKIEMDRAFQSIKDCYEEKVGHDRLYVQLPTTAAHEYHLEPLVDCSTQPAATSSSSRLHSSVAQKIRDIVSGGEFRQYYIRHALRKYVEKELSGEIGRLPDKHDLSFYPTIHDLQNHIHRALQDIKDGTLPFTSTAVNSAAVAVKPASSDNNIPAIDAEPSSSWLPESDSNDEVTRSAANVEAVTLMLTVQPEGQNTVTRVEVKMTDGKTHISSSVPPDIAHIVSLMSPEIFSLKCLTSQVVDESGFDEVPSASLKDDSDGCVLLCNLSEPEVEEASLADCDEPSSLVTESDNTLSSVVQNATEHVECCTTVNTDATLPHDDCCVPPPKHVSPGCSVRTVSRKHRFASHAADVTSRKKRKRQ